MDFYNHLDLFSVGVAIAGTALLGVLLLLNNYRSTTNRAFFYLTFVTVCWSIVNYTYYQLPANTISFLLLRLVIFFATWHAFTFFNLSITFPEVSVKRSWGYRFLLLPIVLITSILTLTPLVFKQVTIVSTNGTIGGVQNGSAIGVFGVVVLFLIVSGIATLARKAIKANHGQSHPYWILFLGMLATFILLLTFNLVIPAVFNNPNFIQFGALFLLPFVLCSAFAILRYHLFNIRVAAIGVLAFALSMAILFNVFFAGSFMMLIFSLSEFVLVLIFCFWLIQGVLREVEQREKIEKLAKELESANERLKELDRLKSEFLSVASHQLRAPITAIRGYIANVLEESYGEVPEYLKDPLEVVQETSRVMVSSIEDYLDVSRIEQGRMKYDLGSIDITDLAKRAADELRPLAEKKGLSLVFSDSPHVRLEGDIGKLKQVFTNIIDNCIKYTETGSVTVSIQMNGSEKTARFMTSDTGIGIAADEIESLFEKFTRARDANKINTTGTGLGLYVAKKLVEGHHGKIWAESDGLGKGSRFIVELPLTQPAPLPEEKEPTPDAQPSQEQAAK